ncbi:hypothetical protein BC835DRAFT_1423488 [Cytidiella melzeri]|nr:hypothetical protein BC835DRAFT_1423488 [Cytidiella melzeri]
MSSKSRGTGAFSVERGILNMVSRGMTPSLEAIVTLSLRRDELFLPPTTTLFDLTPFSHHYASIQMSSSLRAQKKDSHGLGRYQCNESKECPNCGRVCAVRGFQSHFKACEEQRTYAEAVANRKRAAASDLHHTPKRGRHMRQADPGPSSNRMSPISDPGTLQILQTANPFGLEILPEAVMEELIMGSAATEIQGVVDNLTPAGGPDSHQWEGNEDEEADFDKNAPDAVPQVLEPEVENPSDNHNFMPGEDPSAHSAAINDAQIDDIKVEYHKFSRRPTHIYSSENFKRNERTVDLDLLTPEPWKPFKTRLDFEVAEVIHEAKLNSKLTDRLLKAVHKILQKPCNFTLDSSANLNHPLLAPHFEWDAQRLSKFDGTKWVRFYDEPWTASKFAEVQSHISSVRPDGKPLAIILWADTSVLSTFGTQKGHYIVARIGNLPQPIRNGNSVLPFFQVGANAAEQGKPSFVNWKNAVFHEAFRAFLKIVARLSKVGQVVHCGNRISRVLFPYIHILSADYEEQGLGGNAPCPVCLVPKGTLSDLRTRYAYRVAAEVQELVHKVESKKAKEAALKPLGLRAVKNALWDVENSDVHEATSFDCLHAYIIGLFQKHLLPEIKTLLEDMGRWAETTFDEGFQNMEHWPNLSHFTHGLFKMDFSDGKKWEHASKILLHVAYNIFNQERSLKGFALLRLFRSWQELNTYLTFEVQTSVTISAFERTLLHFHDRLAHCEGDAEVKNWDGVIKIHSHLHAARDIRRKGVIANMDTKVNEKMNRPMRETYHRQTNFKNVEPQLGKFDDRDQAAVSIRAHLDALDKQENLVHTGLPKEPKSIEWQFAQVYLGSRQKPTDFKDFAAQAAHDDAFIRFRQKLTDCLTDLIPRENPRGNQLLLNR